MKKNINTITLEEFKLLINASNSEELSLDDKFLNMTSILSDISVEELENMDIDDYKEIKNKSFEVMASQENNTEFISEFEGYAVNFKEDGTPKITTTDLRLIKRKILNKSITNSFDFINAYDIVAAILFRPVIDGKIINSLSDEDIIERAKFFNQKMTIGIIYPYTLKITEKLI